MQGKKITIYAKILLNLHFITPFKYVDNLVTVAQLVASPPGRQDIVGSNRGLSLKICEFLTVCPNFIQFYQEWGEGSIESTPICPRTLYTKFWRYIQYKFTTEEAEVRKYSAVSEFWRFIRSKLRFTKFTMEEAEVRKYSAVSDFWRFIRSKLRFTKKEGRFESYHFQCFVSF